MNASPASVSPPSKTSSDWLSGQCGVGIGWRPELARFIEQSFHVKFVEIIAESLLPDKEIPAALTHLRQRGIPIIPHGITLSLGGAEPLDQKRVRALAVAAEKLQSPLVSEHIAFVRAAGLEAGHLLPVPRTRDSLIVIVENVRETQRELPVPLVLENIATLVQWPDAEYDEADFLTEVLDRTGAWLLLDLANVHANAINHGGDPGRFLDRLPLERIAYVHVAGGSERHGTYHDTHAHPLSEPVKELTRELCRRRVPPGILLERDDQFPQPEELASELSALAAVYQYAVETAANPRSHLHVH